MQTLLLPPFDVLRRCSPYREVVDAKNSFGHESDRHECEIGRQPLGHHRVGNETGFCDASVLFLIKGYFMIVANILSDSVLQESFILPQMVDPFFLVVHTTCFRQLSVCLFSA
jgi:hypothetical protein